MIKNISSKLVKLELEANNSSSRPPQAALNRVYNPQYKKPPLQILQRDRKEQQDHIQPPLYLEGQMDGPTEDIPDGQDDQYLAYSNGDEVESSLQESEGVELSLQEEEEKTSDAEDPDIDDYCKQFVDFMQA